MLSALQFMIGVIGLNNLVRRGSDPREAGMKTLNCQRRGGAYLLMLIDNEPSDYGYLPSRWSNEMLAEQVIHSLWIADNYIIHKSAMTQYFLKHNKKLKILFQPAYHRIHGLTKLD